MRLLISLEDQGNCWDLIEQIWLLLGRFLRKLNQGTIACHYLIHFRGNYPAFITCKGHDEAHNLFEMDEVVYWPCHWSAVHFEGILPKGPYLPCVSMAGRALLAGYPRFVYAWRVGPFWQATLDLWVSFAAQLSVLHFIITYKLVDLIAVPQKSDSGIQR